MNIKQRIPKLERLSMENKVTIPQRLLTLVPINNNDNNNAKNVTRMLM
jgi:hypothetical protein